MARITNRFIETLTPPVKANKVFWDDESKGFGIRITAPGVKAFVFRYVINKRERRYTIGEYAPAPGLNASAARIEATKLSGMVAKGQDPLENRINLRESPTMCDLCREYLERHARLHKRPLSVKDDESMLDTYIKPKLGAFKVAAVGRQDIDKIHQSLKKHPYRANRVYALLSKMLNLAVEWEWISRNPAKGVKKFPEEKRERWLSSGELKHLSNALNVSSNTRVVNVVRFLMLTGARKGEALKAEWGQIDFERGVWVKPSAHTKQKRTEHVPLSAPALALLSDMQKEAIKGIPHLFPGDKEGKPLSDFKKEWDNIRRAATIEIWKGEPEIAKLFGGLTCDLGRTPKFIEITKAAKKQKIELPVGLQDVRIHDLRHTYASHLVSSGLSLEIVGRLLGHTQASTTQRYAHLADDPLREATNRMGVILETANGKRQSGDVIPMHKDNSV